MSPRVTVVGSLNMDLVIRSPHIPVPGETILGSDFQTIPGGKGANQAVAAARLGANASMIGRLGNDSFADVLLDNLAASGVEARYVSRDDQSPTGVALIVVDDQGENSIVVASGANMRVEEADVNAAKSLIASSDVIVLQLEIPVASVLRAAQIAKQHSVKVVLNPAPARELPDELFDLVDVLVPNETETALLSELEINSPAELNQAARMMLNRGVGAVAITLGDRGALLTNSEHDGLDFPAFEIDPLDTTAAGDAFVAGLGVHLASGNPLADCIQWGNAAGALAAMRFGAQTSAPSREEVIRLINGEHAHTIIGKEA